jgi:hypothetical protein
MFVVCYVRGMFLLNDTMYELTNKGVRGSSTLCLANLGDCALLLIRNGEVILRTSEMQHAFNHPLQASHHMKLQHEWTLTTTGGNTLAGRTDERCNVLPYPSRARRYRSPRFRRING